MSSSAKNQIESARKWLAVDVLPLWSTAAIDPVNGSFFESLTATGEPMSAPRRAMVQARQIYSMNEAGKMGLLPMDQVKSIVRRATDYFIEAYSLPSGAFVHAVASDGSVANDQLDLYSQAFALFGLANAYEVLADPKIQVRAFKLLEFILVERKLGNGGFSEIIGGQVMYEANPHMHLFEAAIAWMRADSDPVWRDLAIEIYNLCRTKFIDVESGALAEHFDSEWRPLRRAEGFIWEPGHLHEWAWLIKQFEEVADIATGDLPRKLFRLAEDFGIDKTSGLVLDEMWSTRTPAKRSSRFWPQGERIKAAVALRKPQAADQAFECLFRYFKNVKPGLWQDTISETGEFVAGPAKASSLYHIINALAEYSRKRPLI